MELKPVNSVDGAYWYLIAVLVGIALLFSIFLAAMAAGIIPDVSTLF